MNLFIGSGVALVTPFKDNCVNFEVLEKLINYHIENLTDAIIVCGTTGESATLSTDEKQAIIKFSVEVAKGRIMVIAGTGTNSTKSSIELSEYAQSVGADGLLLVTPYYNKPTQAGLYAHFEKIACSVKIPIILYNVPSRTGVNLLPETVLKLSNINNIQAIKEASGDISQIAKIIDLCKKDFYVYSGNDDQTIPILSLGGKGVISVTANILPHVIHDIVFDYINGNQEKSITDFLRLRKLNQILFIESNPGPIKQAMNCLGFDVGELRLPLVKMEDKNISLLKQVMIEYGMEGVL